MNTSALSCPLSGNQWTWNDQVDTTATAESRESGWGSTSRWRVDCPDRQLKLTERRPGLNPLPITVVISYRTTGALLAGLPPAYPLFTVLPTDGCLEIVNYLGNDRTSFFVFESVSLRFKAPNAMRCTMIYYTGLQNGQDGRRGWDVEGIEKIGATWFSDQ